MEIIRYINDNSLKAFYSGKYEIGFLLDYNSIDKEYAKWNIPIKIIIPDKEQK